MEIKYIGKCLLISDAGKKILAVGDLHLGYEETLNQAGVFLTRKMFEEMIAYFDGIFSAVEKVDYVVLLGDIKHKFGDILKQEWNDVLALFDYLLNKLNQNGKIIITKGNHDVVLAPITRKRDFVEMRDYFLFNEIAFLHGDKDFIEVHDKKIKYWIMGHGHPAVKLSDGVKVEDYKCFLTGRFDGRSIIILPSFFEYSEGSDPRESDLKMAWDFNFDKFDVKIVEEESLKVLDFGRLEELK
ncbi:MAG: metallophosphoesterase [Nanoarchaeota archaeon]